MKIGRRHNFEFSKDLLLSAGFVMAVFTMALAMLVHVRTSHARDIAPIELQTFTSHSRLLFRVSSDVPVSVKNNAKGFEISFSGISLVDLGAPLGVERQWASKWEILGDSRFENLRIDETPSGVKIIGSWKFPKGDEAPANPAMEHFEYRSDQPVPRYVLDFWPKKGPTVAEARKAAIRAKRISEIQQARQEAQERKNRRIASEKLLKEVGNLDYFCRKPLSDETDVFLHFTPVHEEVKWEAYFPTSNPDVNHTYRRPKAKPAEQGESGASDAEYVSLALKLYEDGNFALALKTIEFFEKEHPKSDYAAEMGFLKANALLKLGHEDSAHEHLAKLRLDYPDTPIAFQTTLYLTYHDIKKNSHLAALEKFFWLIDRYASHPLAWVFHLGAAEMHYHLRETTRAVKEYEWVAKNAPDAKSRAEGALRLGDIFLERRQYAQGLAAYFEGLNRFQKEAKSFAPVHLNRAESLYWMGQYDEAARSFSDFLKQYPSYPEGWRATFRLGEIEARKTARNEAKKAFHWYGETINRYPYSPGATLARLRLAECADVADASRGKGMDLASTRRLFSHEAKEFNGDGRVNLDRYSDLWRLSEMRALTSLGAYEEATLAAIKALQTGPLPKTREVIESDLEKLFRKVVLDLLEGGEKERALAFYQEHYSSIPKKPGGPTSLAPDYLLKLSQAASDLGRGVLARQIAADHDSAHKRSGPKRALASPQLDAELKKSEKAYTSARALWISHGLSAKERIQELLSEVISESPHSYAKEIIEGLIQESEKNYKEALSHAVRAQLLVPYGQDTDRILVKHWVARLQVKSGEKMPAVATYKELIRQGRVPASIQEGEPEMKTKSIAQSLGVPGLPETGELHLARGDILVDLEKWGEAAAAYQEAVEAGAGGNRARYEYARLLRKSGGITGERRAVELFKELAESKEADFWTRLAREALANEQITTAREGI